MGVTANIRPLAADDRASVAAIVEQVGVFSPSEAETALELVDEWLNDGESSGYLCYVIDDVLDQGSERAVHGYVCFGPTPLTDGTYDLYWIAVDPSTQGKG